MKKIIRNAFYLFLPIVLGSLVGFLISNFMDYEYLIKPPFAPPKIVFPIAWSIIYILMGIAYFIYRKKSDDKNYIYYIQLIVNLLWSIIFFVFKWRFVSILWILLLDALIIYTMKSFKKYSKIPSYLFIPYLIWCLFATYLTIGIYILN